MRNLSNLPNLSNLRRLRTWLHRLKNKLAATDGAGIGVIRHRVRSHLYRRRLQLVAVAAAVAVAGGAVTATAAGPDDSLGQVSADSALADRAAAADRADRSQRDGDQKHQGDQRSGAKDGPGKADQAQDKSEKQKQKKQQKQEKKQKKRKKKKSKNWVHPMPGARTTSCYGARWGTMHAGVDLAAAAGTPIRAVGAGRVLGAGWLYPGYGISVVIKHRNGFLTHYAHASKALVSAGQQVKPGQKIAREGSTGDSTGPHLHLEVHRGMWNQIEPTKWLARHGLKIPGC